MAQSPKLLDLVRDKLRVSITLFAPSNLCVLD